MVVWGVAIFSTVLCFALGQSALGLRPLTLGWAILASNAVGLAALLATLALERQSWVKQHRFYRAWSTWLVLWGLYVGGLVAVVPALRDPRALVLLVFPLIGSNGWMLPLFGRIQDAIVARIQLRAKEAPAPSLFAKVISGVIRTTYGKPHPSHPAE